MESLGISKSYNAVQPNPMGSNEAIEWLQPIPCKVERLISVMRFRRLAIVDNCCA